METLFVLREKRATVNSRRERERERGLRKTNVIAMRKRESTVYTQQRYRKNERRKDCEVSGENAQEMRCDGEEGHSTAAAQQ